MTCVRRRQSLCSGCQRHLHPTPLHRCVLVHLSSNQVQNFMGHAEPPGRPHWCGLAACPTSWWSTALILMGCGNAFSDETHVYNVCTANSLRMVGSSTVDSMAVLMVSNVPLWPGRYKVAALLPATRLACGRITPEVIIPITPEFAH